MNTNSFEQADLLIDEILQAVALLHWETETLKHLEPYLVEMIMRTGPALLAPHHDYCPSKDFLGLDEDTIEPVTHAFIDNYFSNNRK